MTTKVVTGRVRTSYLVVFKPKLETNKTTGEQFEKWSAMLLIPKDTAEGKATYKKLRMAEKAELEEKFGDKIPRKRNKLVRDGDDQDDLPDGKNPVNVGDEPYAGHWFVNTSTNEAPQVVDRKREPILNASEFVSGDYCRASLNVKAYDNESRGVSAYLNMIQFLEKGEPLGSTSRPEDDFDVEDDIDESADGADDSDWDDDIPF